MHISTVILVLVVVSVTRSQAYPSDSDKNLGCVCAAVYLPVCGSDGQTYSNPCALGCEQQTNSELHQACEGECPCDELVDSDATFDSQETTLCFCPRLYSPLCASNGRTYPNRCELQCAQAVNPDVTFVRTGRC